MNIISCFINLTTNHTNNLTNFSRNIIACLKTQHNGKIDAGAKKTTSRTNRPKIFRIKRSQIIHFIFEILPVGFFAFTHEQRIFRGMNGSFKHIDDLTTKYKRTSFLHSKHTCNNKFSFPTNLHEKVKPGSSYV